MASEGSGGPEGPADMEETEALLERIRASPTLVQADRDLALLARPELRAIRLQLEYLKPELSLLARGIRHSIVVFGGTGLLDPERAEEALRQAEARASEAGRDPDNDALVRRARTAQRLSRYYAIGRELGRLVGRSGEGPADDRVVIVTGGGPGGMEAANRGAHEAGAASVGLNITLPHEQEPNPYLTPELSFQFRYFALRKMHFMMRARALVALPGGYGTLDELFETLCLIQTGKRAPLPVVLVGRAFWERVIDFDFLHEEGLISESDLALFGFAESADEVWLRIVRWYEERGLSIFDSEPSD